MGQYDSSLTRVRPAFTALAKRQTWIEPLARLGSRSDEVGIPTSPGWAGELAQAPIFEHGCLSPDAYLTYLVDHAADPLVIAHERNTARRGRGEETVRKRTALFNNDEAVRQEARSRLVAQGGRRPGKGQWHVLEGITSVDCALYAQHATIFIEGKRTEPHLTSTTEWHRHRHQVVRNLDCLRADESRAPAWYVLLIVEEGTSAEAEARSFDSDFPAARRSLPHLDASDAADVWSHYLGYTTWQRLRHEFELPEFPDTVADLL